MGPLRQATSKKEILRYPLPDVTADYRWKGLVEKIKAVQKAGIAAAGFFVGTFFGLMSDLRGGLDKFLIDFYTEPAIAEAFIHLLADLRIQQAVGLAKAGLDILRIGDNIGMQDRMLMSPDMWRKYFKPLYRKLVESIRSVRPDIILVFK